MVIVLKPKSAATATVVPDGTYKAALSKVTQFANAYGERVGFEFTLMGERVSGHKVMRSTAPSLSPTGKLADVLRGLLGRDLTPDEYRSGVDVEALVGVVCNVLVLSAKSKNGTVYSNVERIFPITE